MHDCIECHGGCECEAGDIQPYDCIGCPQCRDDAECNNDDDAEPAED